MTETDRFSISMRPTAALPGSTRTRSSELPDDLAGGRPCNDLARLLGYPGIGPMVVQRLMEFGVRSITDLQRRGVDSTVNDICKHMGQLAWRNRSEALAHALTDLTRTSGQGA